MSETTDLNETIHYVIGNDLDESLNFLLDAFCVDPFDEPIFEYAFKNNKLKCAKVVFERGISPQRLDACLESKYAMGKYTLEQLRFLIEVCGVQYNCFPKHVYEKYAKFYDKPMPKERLRKNRFCTVS